MIETFFRGSTIIKLLMLTLLCGQAVSAQKPARKFVFADEFKDASRSPVDPTKRTMQTGGNEQKGWPQTQTAARTGLDQPKVSRLMRGRLSGFSAESIITIERRWA